MFEWYEEEQDAAYEKFGQTIQNCRILLDRRFRNGKM